MAKIAYDLNTDEKVNAEDLSSQYQSHKFCCITNGCFARMYGYALGSHNARFNSYNINEHISSSCIGRDLNFNPHQYVEEMFNIDEIEAFYNSKTSNSNSERDYNNDSKPVIINNKDKTSFRSLNALYAIFSNIGVNGYYNGVPINNHFACRDNYDEKKDGFTGFHVVETSFYKIIPYTSYILFNFTPYGSITRFPAHILIEFEDNKKMYAFYKKHFYNKQAHKRLVIICGTWFKDTTVEDEICRCNIYKMSQFKFID